MSDQHSDERLREPDAAAQRLVDDDPLLTPEFCRLARSRLGWSPEQLAMAAGLSPPTVVQFEAAVRQPRSGTVIALRKALRRAGAVPS